MRNKFMIAGFLFALIGATLPQALLAADAAAPKAVTAEDLAKTPPSATLDIDIKELGLIVGGQSGKGILHYQGKDYPFTLKGVQAGAIVGVTKAQATGDVHFMTKLEDFEGSFSAVGAGAAVVKGGDISRFQNNKGVVFTLKSKTTGVSLNVGLTGGEIKFIK